METLRLLKASALTAIQLELDQSVSTYRDQAQGHANTATAARDEAVGHANTATAARDEAVGHANTATAARDEAVGALLPATGPLHYAIDLGTQGVRMAIDLRTDLAGLRAQTITAGAGLTGGGDLTASRTLALSAATITSLGRADTAVQPARQVATGTGLAGGGDLSANRTLTLDANAQNAVTLRHAQNTDTALAAGTANEISAAQARAAALHAIGLHYAVDIATVSAR